MSKIALVLVAALLAAISLVSAAQMPLEIQTADEYKTLTGDADKIVLVMVHATWCGHCRSLAPDYIDVAKHFDGQDKVVIGKFDAPANEDFARGTLQIRSFPTIFLYKNGEQKTYDGARNKEGLIKFVEENL